MSGLGKGITAASLGRLLKSRGLKVAAQKLDPSINVLPWTVQRPTWISDIMNALLMKTSINFQILLPARCTGMSSTRSAGANISVPLFRSFHTLPTQHSVKKLQGMGIRPDIIVLRCDRPLEESILSEMVRKIKILLKGERIL